MKNIYISTLILVLVGCTYSQNIKCKIGAYPSCGFDTNSTSCLSCSPGFYSNYDLSYGGTCSQCPIGQYADKSGMTSCKQCPEGNFCADPTKPPQPCPRGTFYSGVWSNNGMVDKCGSAVQCNPCPMGTYANRTGSAFCITCPEGFYCPDPAGSPIPCPIGTASTLYYYSYGSSQGSVTCQPCFMGTYANRTGSATCLRCPDGSYCPDPTKAPILCPAGSYRRNGFNNPVTFPMKSVWYASAATCLRCPMGYYSAAGASICIRCPKGSFCSNPTIAPTPCPLGTYSDSEYGAQTCKACPDGTFANRTGSVECIPCPAGFYCADPTRNPVQCSVGTYSIGGSSFCDWCPGGTYTIRNGTTTCTQCTRGMCCDDPTRLPMPCTSLYAFNYMS